MSKSFSKTFQPGKLYEGKLRTKIITNAVYDISTDLDQAFSDGANLPPSAVLFDFIVLKTRKDVLDRHADEPFFGLKQKHISRAEILAALNRVAKHYQFLKLPIDTFNK